MNNKHARRAGVGATLAALSFAVCGCSQQTLDSAKKDVDKNAAVVKREAARAERKARPQLNKLEMGGRVTAALKASENLPQTIRVDADEQGVKLRGRVKNETQRQLAEQVARQTLGGDKTVINDLVIAP